jgi:hypothetical protein
MTQTPEQMKDPKALAERWASMRYERYVGTRESECWRAVVEDVLYGYRARDAEVERLREALEHIERQGMEPNWECAACSGSGYWVGAMAERVECDCRAAGAIAQIARQALRGEREGG